MCQLLNKAMLQAPSLKIIDTKLAVLCQYFWDSSWVILSTLLSFCTCLWLIQTEEISTKKKQKPLLRLEIYNSPLANMKNTMYEKQIEIYLEYLPMMIYAQLGFL